MTATAQTTRALLAKAQAAGKVESRYQKDSQKQKLYNAEMVIRGREFSHSLDEKGVYALLERITNSAYVIKHYGKVHYRVSFRGARSESASANYAGTISLPNWALNNQTVIHEVAHLYTMHEGRGHGWLFCAVYLDLVRKFMGEEAAAALKASYKRHGVKFRAPQTRTMTPEQREAARERLAAARAKRAASTGEWIIAIRLIGVSRFSYVKSVGKRTTRTTRYPALAMVRKTDASAQTMLTNFKRRTWNIEKYEIALVNRLEIAAS